MIAALDINIQRAETSKLNSLSLENLPFGKYYTDHMLEADYEDGGCVERVWAGEGGRYEGFVGAGREEFEREG